MNEGTKTGIMAIIAGVVGLLAWATSTKTYSVSGQSAAESKVGKVMFDKFSDPIAASSLKILRYDKEKESYVDFEVARDRKTGVWTIPSHEGYPADANKQMSDAANLFIELKALAVQSQKRDEQILYGVVEPDKQNASQGGEGVGMLVQMRDDKGDILADLIVGKEAQNKKQHYVRIPSEDVIYLADIDTAPLATDFKQWIEADLLKLSSNDIETLGIRDYALIEVQQGLALSRNYEADIAYVVNSGQWQSNRITEFEAADEKQRVLTPDEQLNSTKLNDMKSALDNLRIVNVLKKPAGLAADLKADNSLLTNRTAMASLVKRGFIPNPSQSGSNNVDIYATNGELQVTLKDGVQYLLRFGGSASADIGSDSDSEDESKKSDAISINRFLLVTTRVEDSKFPMPELEKVPETVEELKAMEALKQAKPNSLGNPADAHEHDGHDHEHEDAPQGSEPAAPGSESNSENKEPASDAGDKPNADGEAPGAAKPEQARLAQPASETRLVSFQDPAQPPTTTAPAPANSQEPSEQEWKERLDAAREKVTKDNKRKLDQRNEKLDLAKKKVNELNARFADWYYVISEAEFKRLHIPLSELIQPKGASSSVPGGGFAPPGGFPGGGFPSSGFPE